MSTTISRPDASEYAPYYSTYVSATADTLERTGKTDIRDLMEGQCDEIASLVRDLSDEAANKAYAPGKWSLKESIVHMSDTERVFAYRALRIGRGDATPLVGFEQDDYVATSGANSREMADIVAEFRAVRAA